MSEVVSITGPVAVLIETAVPEPVEISIASVGPQGPKGEPGADGAGVPPGGTAGQVMTKTGDGEGEAAWADPQPPLEIDGGTF